MANILQAIYASNNKGLDVTATVQSITASGNDDIPANNATFGDPDVGSLKYFTVWYTSPGLNNGNPVGLACSEGQTIDLIPTTIAPPFYSTSPQPGLAQSAVSSVSVERAVYGTPNNGFDVTAICQALFNQGALVVNGPPQAYSLPVNNTTFGGDPDVGNVKSLAMQYQMNGAGPFFIGAGEGQTLVLPASPQAVAELIAVIPATAST
jgi:hypothetical protein